MLPQSKPLLMRLTQEYPVAHRPPLGEDTFGGAKNREILHVGTHTYFSLLLIAFKC